MGVWSSVCEGTAKPLWESLPSNWSCYGQTPGQSLIALNSNYIIRGRLLKLSEKQCDRNGEVLIEALEQKNPEGSAILPGRVPRLGSKGLCGVQGHLAVTLPHWGVVGTPLLSSHTRTPGSPGPGTSQETCSHTQGREAACAARGRKSAWKYRGTLPTEGRLEIGCYNVFQASVVYLLCHQYWSWMSSSLISSSLTAS